MNDATEKRTHYGHGSRKRPFEYYTMRVEPDGSVFVYGWGTYERSSVLAGQAQKINLGHFDTPEAAQALYGSMEFSSKWTEPQVSLNHLPDENDPVPGGMYPDDIGGGYGDW